MKEIEIFKTGTHTDSKGTSIEFTEKLLSSIAKSYDPSLMEAPIVIGHPKENAPAYGWVKAITAKNGKLYAHVDQVDHAFSELVKEGKYKKISASFYLPHSPANPKPETYYLRHVGFLGAQAPAVKGLKAVQFSENEDFVQFGEEIGFVLRLSRIFASLRDYLVEKEGVEKADLVLPSYSILQINEDATLALNKEGSLAYSENQNNEESMKNIEELQQKENALLLREQEIAQKEADFKKNLAFAEAQGIVEKALVEGKLTPVLSVGLVEFMSTLQSEEILSFSENNVTKSLSSKEFMKNFIENLPKQIDFSEQGKPQDTLEELTPQEAAQKVVAYQEKLRKDGILISTTEAMTAIKSGKTQIN